MPSLAGRGAIAERARASRVLAVDVNVAHKIALAFSAAIGVVFPYNAKLNNAISPNYPMHYIPEFVVMPLTIIGGLLAF